MKATLERKKISENVRFRSPRTVRDLISDVKLIEEFESGNRGAFEKLIHRYYGPAMKIAYGFVGHRELTQDIVQEAFAKAYKALPGYDHSRPFSTWFFRIVTNLCIDKLRRRGHRSLVSLENARDYNLEPASGDHARHQSDETAEAVQDIMERMPEKYVTVLTMRDLNTISCERIADILHVSASTVRWRLSLARRMFRERWNKKYRD